MGHQGQGRSTMLKIDVVETSETKLSSIEDGLKDVDSSVNDHDHIQHSRPSKQVLIFSPLEHEEQSSDSSNLSHQEKERLTMIDSEETKDTLPAANDMSKGSISNGRPYGAAVASASVSSHNQAWQLDLLANSVSLDQLDQDRLKTQQDERVSMGEIKLPEEESVPKKGFGGNKSQVRHTDSGGDRVNQTVVSSQAKRCSNHAWIYDKRGSVWSSNKRHKGKSMQHSFCHADRANSTNSLSGTGSLCVDVESDESQEEKYIAWLDYSVVVEWKFELTADQRILKSLAGQGRRRCTRAYAKLFGSIPKKLESQLKGEDRHLVYTALSETNVKLATNKEESRKQIGSDTGCGPTISNPIFIRFSNQSEVRCNQTITFPLIFNDQDKKGSKKNDSGTVSSATIVNPVLKQFGSQLQVSHNKMVTSLNNSQGQSLSTVTKEVKNKGAISSVKVQDTEKQKVNSAYSSPTPDGRFSPKSGININMSQE
ncbi:OLC1v1000814C1 [Oldenlandia corymbosa var. corymbosa]|uniref:OLC1v1000814C1 n=1 Tax=Oldenlandia corymbosa var. corymbosa TaxID=529605 RepID=A0AAV1D5D5_OLDCO|nr:OLC1v1000814C1 [Oldenlandia corymbosa var. corymbosa]